MIKFFKKIILTIVVVAVVFAAYRYYKGEELPTVEEIKQWGDTAGDKVQQELEKVDYQIESNTIFDEDREFLEGNGEKITLGGEVSKLSVEVGGFAFQIKSSEDDEYHIQADGNGKIQAYIEGDTLYVKAVRTVSDQKDSLSSKIYLYAPEKVQYDEVTGKLGAGQIDLSDLSAKQMKLEVGAGQIKGNGNSVEEMDLEVGMGAATFTDAVVQQLDAKVGMGAVQIFGDIQQTADLECSMGAMELKLAGEEKDFNYDLEGAAGNFIIGDEKYTGLTQELNLYNGAVKNIDIECAVGSVAVKFE